MTRKKTIHEKLADKARRATKAVKDPTLRAIAFSSILRHLYETGPRRNARKRS